MNRNVIIGSFGKKSSFSQWGWSPAVLLNAVEYKGGLVMIPAGTEIEVDIESNIGKYNDESFDIKPYEYMLQIQVAN